MLLFCLGEEGGLKSTLGISAAPRGFFWLIPANREHVDTP